ncbi:protein FAM114A2 [Bradysia coprophila]|uniref:protein FAM114A2 n=1 Tax=Bradysia coprophila TaxID=38358 RepID=UPI00187D8E93|nr:protein FAM114A2 [Bradysia coprophila]
MSSSDSEAFESADEDVIETKTTTVKKVEKLLNVDDVKESEKHRAKQTEPEPLLKESSKIVPDTVISASIGNQRLDEVKINKLTASEPTVSDSETENLVLTSSTKEPIPVAQIERKASKQSLTSSCELVEMDSITKSTTTDTTDTKAEDDWDFEKWDEMDNEIDEIVAKLTNSDNNQTLPTIPTKTEEQAEKLSDEDGWQIDDWDDDVTPTVEPTKDVKTSNEGGFSNVLDKLSSPKPAEPSNNWGWTPWGGMVQLLSTATSHVSQVIESGMGVPDPEEIARMQHEENVKNRENPEQVVASDTRKDDKSMLLGNLMSGVSQIGNRVISGGLDSLESIGKKTMTILQENDPGLLNKRKMLGMMDKDTPVLSQILREAKEKTEEAEQNLKEIQKQRYKKQLHFETLFDDYHGLVHLEALEMLSQQSALKLKALMAPLTGLALSELEETLNEVKELCELPEMDNEESDGLHTTEELSDKFKTSVEDLDVTVDFKEIIQCWSDNISWLDSETTKSHQEIYEKALRCLAQTSAICINKMHKLAELLLIKEHHSTADEADSLVQITSVMCWHLSGISARFGNSLSQMENKDEVNSLITSIFLEGSNSTSYVQNAFQLFIPILQMGAA